MLHADKMEKDLPEIPKSSSAMHNVTYSLHHWHNMSVTPELDIKGENPTTQIISYYEKTTKEEIDILRTITPSPKYPGPYTKVKRLNFYRSALHLPVSAVSTASEGSTSTSMVKGVKAFSEAPNASEKRVKLLGHAL
ncbi:hypothetical protein CDAR_517541 [Caerostris darwini]|uniref:Uncharacterized protein n=1 Tax=Caerostris darwini TaxID=1538125 RepID=A0AAV4PKC5_9ARAC|nr:hypothetical protein CDAR_517541 [Caerostris darwini]